MSMSRIAKPLWLGCTLLLATGCLKRDAVHPSQSEWDAQKLQLAKLTAEVENLREVNVALEDDLVRTKDDLDYVEKQFIILEHRLMQSPETKASAVAALAEAKLGYEKLLRENPKAANKSTVVQAKEKMDLSDEMLAKKRYAAAIYFANRAARLLNERPHEKTILIVSVGVARLRNGPGTNYSVLAHLSLGSVLYQLERQDGWYRVETERGRQGWIHESIIE